VLAIDEIQLVPRLMRSIKAEVDRDRRPGRFIITGSTRLLATPGMSESLAGRIEILELWPLTRAEINGSPGDFVDRLFNGVGAVGVSSTLAKQDYMELACIGGFPEATKRTGTRRRAWFQNYVDGVIERVVSEVADIRREGEIPQLFKLCAARSGQEVNVADLGAELGLPARTANAYLSHLSTVFLVQLIPAWSTNITAKVVRKPKLMAIDSGLAAHALGHDAVSLQSPNAPLGPVMETFAVMELRKLIANSSGWISMSHYRDRQGYEVDAILEGPGGAIAGVEIKAGSTVGRDDFRGLRLLAERLGDRFKAGVVLYTGRDTIPFGDRLAAVPLAALWS
jgi:uncharacterized protein